MDFQSTIHIQKEFFDKFRPLQPIVRPNGPKNKVKEIRKRLKEINLSFISDADTFIPSVRAMAKHQNLLLLYDYLYNATSRLVHFSTGTLLRMAWGEIDGAFQCNPDALEKYYSEFTKFYSAHLLSALATRFKSRLQIDDKLWTAIDANLREANSLIRWPELITFEELNAPNPWEDEVTMKKMSFWNILLKDPGVIFAPQVSPN